MGSPRASRVVFTPVGASCRCRYIAVASPSMPGIRRDDDLQHATLPHALDQLADLQVFRADAFHRRNRAVQHVIAPLIRASPFHGQHVERLLDHHDLRRIAARVGADGAGIVLGDIEADRAVAGLGLQIDQRRRQRLRDLIRRAQQINMSGARQS